ncbi:MAG: hypothetical protein RBG13Loki_2231 [Promethearchaeota archaeon CR_4]|nr:MAG: hypothetical protein RBG13Loki_2231 [Candidatus Lokiarchaeota archaeon CR_4]
MPEETLTYTIDINKLEMESKTLVSDLWKFLETKIPSSKVEWVEKRLTVKVPKGFSKRSLRLKITKFLHQANTAGEYRPIAVVMTPNEYKIFPKKEI